MRPPKMNLNVNRGFNREAWGVSTHVHYDRYNPNSEAGTDVRKSLGDLDYSPLRRVTWHSFNMGILISMGGFMLVSLQFEATLKANCSQLRL